MKIATYSVLFFVILLLHTGLILIGYVPIIPTITASLCLIVLGLLFYEIYKKYRDTNFAKYILIVFVVIWGLIFFSQIDFIPPKQITIIDIFDRPIGNIPISFQDYIGDSFSFAGGDAMYRFPIKNLYLTNSEGKVTTSPRIYFGGRKMGFSFMHIDENELYKNNYEGKAIKVGRELTHRVQLLSWDTEYKACDSIADSSKKIECLKYSLFYSAVKEKDPSICDLYDLEDMNKALDGGQFVYIRDMEEMKYQCMIFVGLINNDSTVCEKNRNIKLESKIEESSGYKDICYFYFKKPELCTVKDGMCKRYTEQKYDPKLTSDLSAYLCPMSKMNPLNYENDMLYLDTAASLYRTMFCN